MKKAGYFMLSCFLAILLNACAFDVMHVKKIPIQTELTNLSKSPFELEKEVNVSLGTGYNRKLKQGTMWRYVGTILYGDVFKTNDQILTVEGSNIYEAYIVVLSGKLVGFFLPVDHSFSPLSEPKELYIRETNPNP
jgi:hypothetical protein